MRKNKFGDKNGGDERDRTADPLLARQVLSQLSYIPIQDDRSKKQETRFSRKLSLHLKKQRFLVSYFLPLVSCLLPLVLVGLSGLEPLTSRLSGVRSNQG